MDDEYEKPPFVHNKQGDRSAAVIHVDLGKGVAAMTICSVVCGVCLALSLVCSVIAWNSITENRITQNRLGALMAQQDSLTTRVEHLEK